MGVIQNSINSAIGTAAAAVAMGKHTLEQQKSVAKQEEANKLAIISEVSKVNKDIEAYNQRVLDKTEGDIGEELSVLGAKEDILNQEAKDLNNKLEKFNQKRDEEFLKTGKDNFGYAMAVEKNIKKQEELNSNLAMLKKSKLKLNNELESREAQKKQIELHRDQVLKIAQAAGLKFTDFKGGNK